MPAAATALFVLALGLRLLFWQATPDAAWSHTAFYKGDAPTWLAYARAIRQERPFELGLPLRPPGNAYLIAALWDGSTGGLPWLRFTWCVLGAAAVVLVYGAARRAFSLPVALVTGLWCAASTGLLALSASLNNETPYLVLVAAILYLMPRVEERRRAAFLVLFGALNAAACLVRVEHALCFALLLGFLALRWSRDGGRGLTAWLPSLRAGVVVCVSFVVTLAPWHLHAWRAIARFNATPVALDAGVEGAYQRLEAAIAHLEWEPAARAERRRLPAFVRRGAEDFVAATVLVRGRDRVRAEDFRVLEQAFGYYPRPLGGHPFVALYGDLNFYLANNPRATGGFDRSPLERPPPLAGGANRYPLVMVQGLPPPDLALLYLPHLGIVNDGYRLGWQWIRGHPRDFLALAWRKVDIFWQGASLGFTGYGLPLGSGGLRRPVDLVTPPAGTLTISWRLALLALVLAGFYRARRCPAAMPWILLLASRLLVTVAFYGYARQGATMVPVVALLAALAVVGPGSGSAATSPARAKWLRGALAAGILLAGIETTRWASQPEITIDGRPIQEIEPFPDQHDARRIET